MIALDSSFLVDYLDGAASTADYLAEHVDKPFFAPSLAIFEVYRGAARIGGRARVEQVQTNLDWIEPLPLTDPTAIEAALVEAELLDTGDRINVGDTLIAGICRHNGARLVTRDDHFERVDGLDVVNY